MNKVRLAVMMTSPTKLGIFKTTVSSDRVTALVDSQELIKLINEVTVPPVVGEVVAEFNDSERHNVVRHILVYAPLNEDEIPVDLIVSEEDFLTGTSVFDGLGYHKRILEGSSYVTT